jgi:hypothetical protein
MDFEASYIHANGFSSKPQSYQGFLKLASFNLRNFQASFIPGKGFSSKLQSYLLGFVICICVTMLFHKWTGHSRRSWILWASSWMDGSFQRFMIWNYNDLHDQMIHLVIRFILRETSLEALENARRIQLYFEYKGTFLLQYSERNQILN